MVKLRYLAPKGSYKTFPCLLITEHLVQCGVQMIVDVGGGERDGSSGRKDTGGKGQEVGVEGGEAEGNGRERDRWTGDREKQVRYGGRMNNS